MSEKNGMTAIWTIEKCSFFLEGLWYSSPTVKNDNDGTKLVLSTRRLKESISVDVFCVDGTLKEVDVDVEVSLLASDGSTLACEKRSRECFGQSHAEGILHCEGVFGPRKEEFLPENKLIVRCCVWEWGEKTIFARTRIGEESLYFVWQIQDFDSQHTPIFKRHLDFSGKVNQFESLRFCLIQDKNGVLFVKIKGTPIICEDYFQEVYCTFGISLMGSAGSAVSSEKRIMTFEWGEQWEILQFECLKDQNQTTLFSNGPVLLRCEFKFQGGKTASFIEGEDKILVNDSLTDSIISPGRKKSDSNICCRKSNDAERKLSNSVIDDWRNMFEEKTICDYTLETDNKTFSVHKAVLCSRSPVFKEMFASDREEARGFSLRVPDDSDTLQRFVVFLYTDELDATLNWEEASKLYTVAHKYEVWGLREKCSSLLVTRLSATNVCDILVLSDLHKDDVLRKAVLDFFSLNDTLIVGSRQWKELEESNLRLAYETIKGLDYK